jgi:formate hydrogenlyase subunit 4
MAARHWVLFVLGAQLFLPHPGDPWWQLATLPVAVVALCAAVALTETLVAKMRVLAVPRLLAAAVLVALLGVVARLMGLI